VPIYEYECRHCGSFEHSQSIHDRPLERCPKCRRKVQRLISATNFQLKGGGWYSDGYQKKSASSSGSDAKASDSKGADSKGTESKGTDSKPSEAGGASKKKAKSESRSKKASSASTATSSD